MVRQPLNTAAFVGIVLAASLLAGCAGMATPAGQPPPAPGPAPVVPGEAPQESPPAPVQAPPGPDTRAPTVALLRQSQRSADDGDLDSAIAYVERAIRLDSRDAALWLRLARLQLAAHRPVAAEQLAHKAIALAGSEEGQQREGWLLVADALEAQGDDDAAAAIRARWRTYRG